MPSWGEAAPGAHSVPGTLAEVIGQEMTKIGDTDREVLIILKDAREKLSALSYNRWVEDTNTRSAHKSKVRKMRRCAGWRR